MKKASNIIESALLLCVIVTVIITIMTVYNNQKIKLSELSSVTLTKPENSDNSD